MEIKVTSCADCPFCMMADSCGISGFYIWGNYISETKPASCPLKQQSITVKLEENEDPRKSDYQHFSSGKL